MDNYNPLNTVDRLIEFGMGMAVAQQMIGMMNYTMSNMQVPGVGNTIPQPKPQGQFYALIDNNAVGPLSEIELTTLVKNKSLTSECLVWKPGMAGWTQAKNSPEINKLILLNS